MTTPAETAGRGRLLWGSASFFVSRVAGAALAYGTQILLARWMGASELGAYLFAFSGCLLLSTLSGLGYPSASFRFIGHGRARGDDGYLRGYIRRGRQISLGSGLLLAATGAAGIFLFPELLPAEHLDLAILALLCVPLMALVRLHSDVANSFSWLSLTIVPNTLARPLLFLIAVAVVWQINGSLTAGFVMWAQLGAVAVILAAQHLLLRIALNANLGDAAPTYDTGLWTRAATPMCVVLLLTSYFPEFNVIFVGLILSPDQLAIFNAAFRTAFLIAFLLNAVDASTLPQISLLYSRRDRAGLRSVLARAAGIKVAGSLAGVAALALVGKPTLALFGPEFVAGYSAMLVLAGAQLMQAVFGPVTSLLEIAGHQNRCLYVFGSALTVAAALHLWLAPILGLFGSAIAVLGAVTLWTIWLYALVRKYIGVDSSVMAVLGPNRRPAGPDHSEDN